MKKNVLLMFVILILLATTPAWAESRAGQVQMNFDLSAQSANEPVELWIPYPVSNPQQQITQVHLEGNYATAAVYALAENGAPLLYAKWAPQSEQRTLSLSFNVQREEIRRGDLPTSETPWNPADYADYLGPTVLGPIDGPVKDLADKITAGKTTVLQKARAIYDWTVENMYRDPDTIGCGIGDVYELLHRLGGKCTDIHSVYVALCRAAGVPAREIFGLRLGKKATQDITSWQHCWAEFFLPGYGWVVVDPADVRKAMLVEKLELDSPRVAELRDYFWGGIDAYRFELSRGRDLVLNPPQAGKPLNTFGYPYAEVGGKPLDFYAPKTFSYQFTYREL